MTRREISSRIGTNIRRQARDLGIANIPGRAMSLAAHLGWAESRQESQERTLQDGMPGTRQVVVWSLTAAGEVQAAADILSDPAARRVAAHRAEARNQGRRQRTPQTSPRPHDRSDTA